MRKLLFLALALVLICFMVSCAQKNPENESTKEVSDPVIVEKNPQENAMSVMLISVDKRSLAALSHL